MRCQEQLTGHSSEKHGWQRLEGNGDGPVMTARASRCCFDENAVLLCSRMNELMNSYIKDFRSTQLSNTQTTFPVTKCNLTLILQTRMSFYINMEHLE